MSTLNTQNLTNGTDSITIEGAVKGSAKAWVNFNGTGTVAIRASYNVSGLTDHATGQYTVSFTTALSNTNYSVVGSATRSDGSQPLILGIQSSVSAPTTSAVRLCTLADDGSFQDSLYTNVSIFR